MLITARQAVLQALQAPSPQRSSMAEDDDSVPQMWRDYVSSELLYQELSELRAKVFDKPIT
jgi:chemotaxis regulatin CheY-phosphate phosphatase CheZ